jgi:hypothetical protein
MKEYLPPLSYPVIADRYLVWGEADAEQARRAGANYAVVGSPVLQWLKPRARGTTPTILFCPTHDYRESARYQCWQVARRLLRCQGTLVAKLLDRHCPVHFPLFETVVSAPTDADHLDRCADALARADVVVGMADGTFELMACAMDIPVVMVDVPGNPHGQACRVTDLDGLPAAVSRALDRPEELRAERRAVACHEGGWGMDSTANILREIERL